MLRARLDDQYRVLNPYNAVRGGRFELSGRRDPITLTHVGPSRGLACLHECRITARDKDFKAAASRRPRSSSSRPLCRLGHDYRTVATRFATRWGRAYFKGLLSGGAIDHTRLAGQRFSFPVRDVYGTKVLPENLGSSEPEQFCMLPTRFPADILAYARRVRVVRDGFASFYFHPFLSLNYLKETVEGLQAAGWTFVNPATL